MPPYPRPVSPILLESCSLPVSDMEQDGLLGSDDELDEFERAAKRQRIEKLAEAYLQGSQLFMLSSSLRGPFDKDWKNPWKKTRKSAGARTLKHKSKIRREYVVQETDLRQSKFRGDIASDSQPQARPNKDTSFVVGSKPAQKRIFQQQTETNESPRVSKKPKRSSRAVDKQSFAENKCVEWLRKDKELMSFTKFDPPSSPTPKSELQSSHKNARSGNSSCAREAIVIASRARSPKGTNIVTEQPVDLVKDVPPQQSRLSLQKSEESPASESPLQELPPAISQTTSSFKLLASTSQLPRFEYRQRYNDTSSHNVEQCSPKSSVKALPPRNHVPERRAKDSSRPIIQGSTDDLGLNPAEPLSKEQEQPIQFSKSLRFADDTDYAESSDHLQTLTEPNTYEELPSAQQVPALPGISDRIQSLHSTVVPKEASQQNSDTSHDTQLSTQAAFMYAQKSFQNDLESPAREYESTPSHRAMADIGNDSLLAQETPLFRPDTSERVLPQSFKNIENDRIQAMSTQCMIEAATPFTFSTEKKPTAARLISPRRTSPRKSRMNESQAAKALSLSQESSTNMEVEGLKTTESNADDANPCENDLQSDQKHLNQSTTQFTALPFSVSGSTPLTMQDGQGVDNFHLSQAIADAGSWLKQSFDIFKETGRPSQTSD